MINSRSVEVALKLSSSISEALFHVNNPLSRLNCLEAIEVLKLSRKEIDASQAREIANVAYQAKRSEDADALDDLFLENELSLDGIKKEISPIIFSDNARGI